MGRADFGEGAGAGRNAPDGARIYGHRSGVVLYAVHNGDTEKHKYITVVHFCGKVVSDDNGDTQVRSRSKYNRNASLLVGVMFLFFARCLSCFRYLSVAAESRKQIFLKLLAGLSCFYILPCFFFQVDFFADTFLFCFVWSHGKGK